jgi:protein-disulfide isomerase
MKSFMKATILILPVLILAATAAAQQSSATKEEAKKSSDAKTEAKTVQAGAVTINMPEGMNKEQADAILNELRQIRQLLEKQQKLGAQVAAQTAPPPQNVSMSVSPDWHSIGKNDAPVTIVEFADYQCPFCKNFHTSAFSEVKKNYIDTGKVRFVSRDLPLDFHPLAMKAAVASLCAADQGKYWEMRDALISNSPELSPEALLKYAQGLSPDMNSFRACLDSGKHKSEIQKDLADAAALNISGTPTFVLGKTSRDKLNGLVLVGAQSYSTFDSAIQQALKGNPSVPNDKTK